MSHTVLVTGGAGYIGSAVCNALSDAGNRVVILDSLVNGDRAACGNHALYVGDMSDRALIGRIIAEHPDLYATIHMAAFVEVPASIAHPLNYYENNVGRALVLAQELAAGGIERFIFSSSASLYRAGGQALAEDAELAPSSPYARSKWLLETALDDAAHTGALKPISLRYFNPIGADPQGRSGPSASESSHVLGRVLGALDNQQPFRITGTDYPTRDGSGLRDYVHVWDVALAHVAAVERFDAAYGERTANLPINIGTGSGVTVRELVALVQRVAQRPIEVTDAPRRPGDVAGGFAAIDRARELLGWSPKYTVEQAIASALAWRDRANRPPGVLDVDH